MNAAKNLESEINQFLAHTDIVCHGENMLERMRSLANALGNPEKKLKIIHVAGTSGKTSTCYFAAAQLKAAGFKVGLTVSPHIDSVRERAMINLAPLSESDWTSEMQQYFTLVKQSGVKPSYFEFYMEFAFWLFAKQNVDYAVVETGLGGTWDGSNITTEENKVCIITDIGYDHTEILGDNLATIASEKAGIIHKHNATFMYPQSAEIMNQITDCIKTMQGTLHIQDDVTTNFMERNFTLAKSAIEFVINRDHQKTLTPAQIKTAKETAIPARAEKITYQNQTIIMDGSHNPQKLTAFTNYLNKTYPSNSRVLIATLGANKTANLDESMQVLRTISDHLILTSFTSDSPETNKRTSIEKDLLLAAAKKANFAKLEYIGEPTAALKTACAKNPDQIIITGSFYLLNHLRPILI